jgi:hypothetical protein
MLATRSFKNGGAVVGFVLGLLTAWIGKRAIAFIDWLFGALWAWWRATPSIRCYAVSTAYIELMREAAARIEKGEIDDPRVLELLKRLDCWIYARLKRWQERVWDKSLAKS